jgi:branched-subunit amino acid transport protein
VITLALFAAAGAVTWLLRAAFITLVPARRLPTSVVDTLRYAGPAAFAALLVTTLTAHPAGPTADQWQAIAAVAVAALVTWRIPNLMVTIATGAVAVTVLSLF